MAPIADKDRDRAQWSERFAGEEYWFGTEPNAFLAAEAHRLKPGMRALAIADGEGRNGVFLARQGLIVTSVDLTPAGVDKGKRLAARFGVPIDAICADLEAWDWGLPRFDVVVGIFFQFAAPRFRESLFRQMVDVLKPGGLIMIEAIVPSNSPTAPAARARSTSSIPPPCCAPPSPIARFCFSPNTTPNSMKAAVTMACRR